MNKLNDLPLSETIKYIELVICEYEEELHRPENADIKSRIWDAQHECRGLLKELLALKDTEIVDISSQQDTSTFLDCWKPDPELLLTNPPKHIWICRYCNNKLITDVGKLPDRPCDNCEDWKRKLREIKKDV